MKGVNGAISYQDVKMHKSEDVTYHCNGKEFVNLVAARVYKKNKNIMYGYVKYIATIWIKNHFHFLV